MWPFYEICVRRNQPIWIHPQHTDHLHPLIKESLLERSLGRPFDIALAMAHLVWGEITERHPKRKVISHHLGGMVPHFGARLQALGAEIARCSSPELTKKSVVTLPRPIGEHFRRSCSGTAISYAPESLECGLGYFGDSHVLFTTDVPVGSASGEQWTRDILRAIADAELAGDARARILGDSATALLGV